MARIRTVKPEFFENETLVELGYPSMLLFIGLWQQCDAAGRCEDRPKKIKAKVFPYTNEDVDLLLKGLAKGGFVVRYEVEGRSYLWVPTFRDHQRITGKEAEVGSRIPAAPGDKEGQKFPPRTPKPPTFEPERTEEDTPENLPGNNRDAQGKNLGHTQDTPETHPGAQEGKGKELINTQVDREEPLSSDSSGDEPSDLALEELERRAFWESAGQSKDPVVRALCKACFGIPKFKAVVPPGLATVEKVVARLRAVAPHDAAILAEVESFELFWSSQKSVTGKGQWWLSIGKWCDKCHGKWALAKKRGGLMPVNGGAQRTPAQMREDAHRKYLEAEGA